MSLDDIKSFSKENMAFDPTGMIFFMPKEWLS